MSTILEKDLARLDDVTLTTFPNVFWKVMLGLAGPDMHTLERTEIRHSSGHNQIDFTRQMEIMGRTWILHEHMQGDKT